MRKLICFMIVMSALCGLFTGCSTEAGGDTPQPDNVACVVTIANNNPIVDAAVIRELAALPSLPGSTYTVINAEGTPQIICSGEIPDFADRGYSQVMLERIQSSIQADICGQINGAAPATPEVDLASATVLALRTLRANAAEGRDNLLVYYCSGISTCGVIDMVSVPVCELDIETSVADLAAVMALDMQGIDVIMYCCGDVAGETQSVLSLQEQNRLKDFYEQLFLTMGADSITFMEDLPAEGAYAFEQPVTAMRTEGSASALRAAVIPSVELEDEEAVADIFAEGSILSFDEASIRFLPSSTELADPAAAAESLSYVIDYMLSHPDFELLICGTTASAGTEVSCMAFSEQRAARVRDILVAAGVDASRIHILGCGYSSILYVPDRNSAGQLNESIAPQNRSVKLVAYNSDTARQVFDSLNIR